MPPAAEYARRRPTCRSELMLCVGLVVMIGKPIAKM
jgi:hypothetical protein